MNTARNSHFEIEMPRTRDPGRALGRPSDASSDLAARPEARLLQAELVHRLQGPAAARPLLAALVAAFPEFASAHHLLAQVNATLGNEAEKIEHYMSVHRLDAKLDEALERSDAEALERGMDKVASKALATVPAWSRKRFELAPITWRARPDIEQVRQGFDPRALAALVAAPGTGPCATPDSKLRLVLYRTNLLASAADEAELREKVSAAVRNLLRSTE